MADLVQSGLDEAEACRRAAIELGGMAQVQKAVRASACGRCGSAHRSQPPRGMHDTARASSRGLLVIRSSSS
jgi:hypothetical protein